MDARRAGRPALLHALEAQAEAFPELLRGRQPLADDQLPEAQIGFAPIHARG
jgi:hypothetical protein